jgi:hypothetical protein
MNLVAAPNIRYATIDYGDDLRSIALRELGDATNWVTLVIINELKPPYIADIASNGVLTYGDAIKIPSSSSYIDAGSDSAAVFSIDISAAKKKLTVVNGDLAVVSGLANLYQALTLHIDVDKKELGFHPEFGCYVRSVMGAMNGPIAGQLAAFYVKSALIEDVRVNYVSSCTATVVGDVINVEATVVPISGKPLDLLLVV